MQTHLRPDNDSFRTLFTIADFDFGWYPFLFIIGFFVCIIIASLVARYRYKVSYDIILWLSLIIIPSAILGARLWSAMIGDLDWKNFFKFQTGGLAIQGGVVFAFIASIIFLSIILKKPKFHVRVEYNDLVKIEKPSIWIFIDILLPLILFGQAIGRWGNFFNGEIFGQQVSAESLNWLKILMPAVFDHMQCVQGDLALANGLVNGAYYQPLFLYESTINIIFFLFIYFLLPSFKKIKIGVIGSSYFIIYGIIRFIFEPLRFQSYAFAGTYVINSILLVTGIVLVILTQFILPKYRHKQILYMIWIKYIRFYLIKIGIKLKINKAIEYTYHDKNLENYGFEKKYDFDRDKNNPIYYGNR